MGLGVSLKGTAKDYLRFCRCIGYRSGAVYGCCLVQTPIDLCCQKSGSGTMAPPETHTAKISIGTGFRKSFPLGLSSLSCVPTYQCYAWTVRFYIVF